MLTGDPQAQATPPSSSPRISNEQPDVSSTAPATSISCRSTTTFSWKLRSSTHVASTAIGMLTKKIQRQDRYCAKTPPSVGPTTEATAHTLAM